MIVWDDLKKEKVAELDFLTDVLAVKLRRDRWAAALNGLNEKAEDVRQYVLEQLSVHVCELYFMGNKFHEF